MEPTQKFEGKDETDLFQTTKEYKHRYMEVDRAAER